MSLRTFHVCLLPRISLILGALALSSCAGGAVINVVSNPEKAEIYAQRLGSGSPTLAGQTPLTVGAAELERTYQGAGPIYIELRKPGYRTVSTVITDLSAMNLTIKMDMVPQSGGEDQDRLNTSVDRLFESQRLAKAGRFPEALELIRKIRVEVPEMAAAYEIEGGIFYLQKEYRRAYDSYSTAVKYNSKNPETLKMRKLLETSLGIKPGPQGVKL